MTLSLFNETIPTTDATFRTACLAWDTAIKAVGLIASSDTGQMNFTTVTRPTLASTKAGYVIYQFNDASQGLYPCFIRIDYGTGIGATNTLALWVTVGTSTDGAGTLGAIKTTTVAISLSGTAVWASACSGSTSRLTMAASYNSAIVAISAILSIERIQDSSGADTTTGLVFTFVKGGSMTNDFSYNGQQVLYFSGTQPLASYSAYGGMPPMIMPFNATAPAIAQWADSNKSYVGVIYPIGKTVHPPIQGMMTYFIKDIATSNQVPIVLYGTSRNWLPIGTASVNYVYYTTTVAGILVRWD